MSEGYQLRKSQLRTNSRVVALTNCLEHQIPVVLIAGSFYPFFSWLSDMHVRYAVLGYYMVTDIWVCSHPCEIFASNCLSICFATSKQAEAELVAKGSRDFFVRFKVSSLAFLQGPYLLKHVDLAGSI